MKNEYVTKGVCSKKIDFEVEDGIIRKLKFEGGCEGNLKGLCALAVGREAKEVIQLLSGTRCGSKKTSCPDQLSKALKKSLGPSKKRSPS